MENSTPLYVEETLLDAPKPTEAALSLEAHIERLSSIKRNLWRTHTLDLHMSDGTVRLDQHGLLQNLRDDIRVVLSALNSQLAASQAPTACHNASTGP